MEEEKLILQYMQGFKSGINGVDEGLNKLLVKPLDQQLNESSGAETIKLANGSAYLLVSLCFAYLKSQGVDTSKHPIMGDLNRVRSYMKRAGELEKEEKKEEEADDEATKRANEFIRSALGKNKVVIGSVGPAVSFKGKHTKFKVEKKK